MPGTFKLIGEVTGNGSATELSFNSISGYDQLYIVGSVKAVSTGAPSYGNLYIQVNGAAQGNVCRDITLENYPVSGSSSNNFKNTTQNSFGPGRMPNANAINVKASLVSQFEFMFTNVRNTSNRKVLIGRMGYAPVPDATGSTTNTWSYAISGGVFESLVAITGLTFGSDNGAFSTNSSITLYGLANS
jgi:hypothetical protein